MRLSVHNYHLFPVVHLSHLQADRRLQRERELLETRRQIDSIRQELSEVEPECEEMNAEQSTLRLELTVTKHRCEALYGKLGRGRRFRSKKERDKFLETQVKNLATSLHAKRELLARLEAEHRVDEEGGQREALTVSALRSEEEAKRAEVERLAARVADLTEQRGEVWREKEEREKEVEELSERVAVARRELERGKHALNCSLPRHITLGLACVERVVAERKIVGYFGPLIDNFHLTDPVFRTPVEVAAGLALFHVLVDTDSTAAALMKELERRKAGRLTFLPLNRIRPEAVRYPTPDDAARPLLDVALRFEPRVDLAMKQVE